MKKITVESLVDSGITQRTIAEVCGVSYPLIVRWRRIGIPETKRSVIARLIMSRHTKLTKLVKYVSAK